ncbi:MAG TPA: glycosyltransferase family 2 protein [Candidatus Saccharimonadales bacterium]|nr:glycosyltransferase family 2 protein [Candidatus Saccharimonadales bacterium]
MKEPLVCIIILNWNGLEDTIDCLNSVLKIDYPNYKIILVDNGSKDNSVKELQKKFSKIPLIINKENLGYAEGNNVGMRYALKQKPAYILFLNNDVTVDKKWLRILVDYAEKHPKVGIVGPKIYYSAKPDTIWFTEGKIDYDKGPFIHVDQGRKDTKENSIAKKVDYINGCSLLIKTAIIKKIGAFDKKYFAYVEDIDLNLRVQKLGYESHIVPNSKIWHIVSASTGGEANPKKEFLKARNLIFFVKKNFSGSERHQIMQKVLRLKLKDMLIYMRYYNLSLPLAIVKGIYKGFNY